jgi:hypothetical protein
MGRQDNADLLLQKTKAVNDGSLHVFFSHQRPHYKEAILKSFGHWVQPERRGSRDLFPSRVWSHRLICYTPKWSSTDAKAGWLT